MVTTEVATRPLRSPLVSMSNWLDIEPKHLVNVLKKTAFRECKTDEEMMAACIVANVHRLNPLTGEIFAFPSKRGGVVPIVSIDGWIKLIQRHPKYNGMEIQDINDESGKIVACKATIWRKDVEHPVSITEYLDECMRNTDPWKIKPRRMLRHKAMIQCARYAFGFSGIYDEDEGEVIAGATVTEEDVQIGYRKKPGEDVPAPSEITQEGEHTHTDDQVYLSEKQRKMLLGKASDVGISHLQLKTECLVPLGIASTMKIPESAVDSILAWIEATSAQSEPSAEASEDELDSRIDKNVDLFD